MARGEPALGRCALEEEWNQLEKGSKTVIVTIIDMQQNVIQPLKEKKLGAGGVI